MSTASSNQHAKALTVARNGADHAELHRQQCVRRIAELKEEIRAVKESYNSVSPAYSLPPEILSTIFLATFARAREHYDYNDEVYCGELQWLVVTQVCQKWRNIALNCAELWSTLCLVNPRITRLMLVRSKQAPLTIDFSSVTDQRPSAYSKALREALSQVHRLRSVSFVQHSTQADGDDGAWTSVPIRDSLASWTGEAPLLEHLSLIGHDPLPTPFLAGGAPVLKTLSIDQIPCTPSLKEFRAPNLTSLYIGGSRHERETNPAPKPEDLLGALPQFPRLEKLELHETLPPAADMASYNSTHPRLCFSNLREVHLGDTLDDVTSFLAACKLPPTTAIHIQLERPEPSHTMDLFGELLQEAFIRTRTRTGGAGADSGGLTRFKIHKFSITNSQFEPCWRCWWVVHHDRGENDHRLPDFTLTTTEFGLSVPQASHHFYNALDFSTLSSLKMVNIPSFTKSDWRTAFGQLPLLKVIEVSRSVMPCLEALGCGDSASEEEGPAHRPQPPLFPALWKLAIAWRGSSASWPSQDVDFDAIARVLVQRSRAGASIWKVVVEGGKRPTEAQYEFVRREAPGSLVEWRA